MAEDSAPKNGLGTEESLIHAEKNVMEILVGHFDDSATNIERSTGQMQHVVSFVRPGRWLGKKRIVNVLVRYAMDIQTSTLHPHQVFVDIDASIINEDRGNILRQFRNAFPGIPFDECKRIPL